MTTPEPEVPDERRWRLLALLGGLLPAAVVAIALAIAGTPAYQFVVLLPVAATGIAIVSILHRLANPGVTDERAKYLDLRARSVGFVVITLTLIGTWAWSYVRSGVPGARPYFYLLVTLYVSYVATMTWLRRRS